MGLVGGKGEPLRILRGGKQCFLKTIPAAVRRTEAGRPVRVLHCHGNGNEDQRKQGRGRTGRKQCRLGVEAFGRMAGGYWGQEGVPLATGEMLGKDGHLDGEERETLGLGFLSL